MLAVSAVICVAGFIVLLTRVSISKLGCPRFHRLPYYAAIAAGSVLLFFAVHGWADREVRANSAYLMLVMVMGWAFLCIAGAFISWSGISLRNDAFEGRNFAAVLALSGAVLGVMLIYTGANLGEGPSFWENVFCSALGLAVWLLLWLCLELGAGVSGSVTEERDTASGLRLAGFLAAEGLVLARALAGNWHSTAETLRDFARDGWPALAMMFLAVLVEWWLRPGPTCPLPSWKSRGLPMTFVYLVLALGWVWHLGWWKRVAS